MGWSENRPHLFWFDVVIKFLCQYLFAYAGNLLLRTCKTGATRCRGFGGVGLLEIQSMRIFLPDQVPADEIEISSALLLNLA